MNTACPIQQATRANWPRSHTHRLHVPAERRFRDRVFSLCVTPHGASARAHRSKAARQGVARRPPPASLVRGGCDFQEHESQDKDTSNKISRFLKHLCFFQTASTTHFAMSNTFFVEGERDSVTNKHTGALKWRLMTDWSRDRPAA